MYRAVEPYYPQTMTLEEFKTLSALTRCLLPGLPLAINPSPSELIDSRLHRSKFEPLVTSGLPTDLQALRAGLQLLDYDALNQNGRPFANLLRSQQDDLLVTLRMEGDSHWPQLQAGKWYETLTFIIGTIFITGQHIYPDWAAVPGFVHYLARRSEAVR